MRHLLSQFVPYCGLHHFVGHHGGSSSAPDPQVDAFVATVMIIALSSVAVLLFCCPFLAIRIRRIRDLFWVVPSSNLALYILSIALREYPAGFGARFSPPGVWYTLAEVIIVLLLSLVVASVTACAMWLVRTIRGWKTKQNGSVNGSEPVSPETIRTSSASGSSQ